MIDLGLFGNLETFGLIAIALVSVILFVLIGMTSMKYLELFDIKGGVGFLIALAITTFLTYAAFSFMETIIFSIWFWVLIVVLLILLVIVKLLI